MSTYKEYINEFGKIITEQQASQVEDYNEKFYENNRLKKIIHYWDRKVQYITMYIYPDDDTNVILDSLQPNIEYAIEKDFEEVNGFKVWKGYHYENGVLSVVKYIEVFDSNNRRVAYKDVEDGTVYKIWYLEGKYVYNEEEELDFYYGDETVTFDYENDELKIKISFLPWYGPFSDIGLLRGLNDLQLPFLTEEIINYFTNPELLIPNIEI